MVRIEMGDLDATIGAMVDAAVEAATEQALADCSIYVPYRYGFLRNSAQTASDIPHGRLVWQTPYARRRYYGEPPLRTRNPMASLHWAEVAAQNHKDAWAKAAEEALGGHD